MKVTWERNDAIERRQQAHVFAVPPDGGPARSLCGTVTRTEAWGPAGDARKCATCRRRVDPDNAPKYPSWRMP